MADGFGNPEDHGALADEGLDETPPEPLERDQSAAEGSRNDEPGGGPWAKTSSGDKETLSGDG